MKNINRIASNRAKGWRVRVELGDIRESRLFSDCVYGGTGKALVAAEEYLDEVMAAGRTSLMAVGVKGAGKTNTGYVGIQYMANSSYFQVRVNLQVGKSLNQRFKIASPELYERVLLSAIRWQRRKLKQDRGEVGAKVERRGRPQRVLMAMAGEELRPLYGKGVPN